MYVPFCFLEHMRYSSKKRDTGPVLMSVGSGWLDVQLSRVAETTLFVQKSPEFEKNFGRTRPGSGFCTRHFPTWNILQTSIQGQSVRAGMEKRQNNGMQFGSAQREWAGR